MSNINAGTCPQCGRDITRVPCFDHRVTERPILFSGPMVRAIIEGRKTQTRRVLRDQQPIGLSAAKHGAHLSRRAVRSRGQLIGHRLAVVHCPYGVPGDRLWVRETLRTHSHFGFPLGECPQVKPLQGRVWSYAADNIEDTTGSRPSIHMPRWACRLVLDLTAVRVERLQEISQQDVFREGLHNAQQKEIERRVGKLLMSHECYRDLWDSLNAKRGFGWETNPWVWVVEFKSAAPSVTTKP